MSEESGELAVRRSRGQRLSRALNQPLVGWLAAVLSGALALFLYLPLVHPGVGPVRFLDSIQYQTVATVFGVSHPPSHPIYILATTLFARLPLPFLNQTSWVAPFGDNIAFRVNLFSAIMAALTVVVMVRLIYQLTQNVLASAFGGLTLAVAVGFWLQATYAELYPTYNFLVVLNFALLLQWMQTRRSGYYYASVFVYALSFGVNIPAIMLLPAWLWAVLTTDHRMLTRPRHLAFTLLLVLLGAAQFIFVPLRVFVAEPPRFCNLCPSDWRELPAFLSGEHWRDKGIAFGKPPQDWMQRWADSGAEMVRSVWPSGLFLAAWGWWWLARHKVRVAGLLTLALIGTWFLVISYDVPDWADFMTPVYVVLTPFIGVGAAALWEWLRDTSGRWQRLPAKVLRPLLLLLLVALGPGLIAASVFNNRPIVIRFVQDNGAMLNHWTARDMLTRMEPDAWLLMSPAGTDGFNQSWAMRQVSWAEGLRPEMTVVFPPIDEPPPGPPPGYVRWDDAKDELSRHAVYAIDLNDERLRPYALLPVQRDDGWTIGYQLVGERTAEGIVPWVSAETWQAIQERILLLP